MKEIEILEQRVAKDAEDAESIHQLAVLLEQQRWDPARDDTSKLLPRIRTLLTRVITLDAKHARAFAQLAYTLDELGENEQALAMFRLARKLDPKRASVDVYVAHMLGKLERATEFAAEVEALARRQKVSLKAHRAEIAKTGWKETADLMLQAFIRPVNFMRSELRDEAEQIRNKLVKGRKAKLAKQEKDDCARRQKQLKKEFKAARVPKELRSLAASASRYGIGDDHCRPYLMKRIPKATRARLIKAADKLALKVQTWLDSFEAGEMTPEAAAYMYLYEGIEEMRA